MTGMFTVNSSKKIAMELNEKNRNMVIEKAKKGISFSVWRNKFGISGVMLSE